MTHRQAVRWGLAWLACTAGLVHAQAPTAPTPSEREQLSRQRQAIESRYAEDVKNCYQRFAVNDCKQQALMQQRESLKPLRAREQALDAAERAEKAQSQKERVTSRLTPQAQEDEAQRRAQAVTRQQNAEQKHREKNQAHAERAAVTDTDTAPREGNRPSPAQLQAAEQSHARKLQDAAEHRAANEQQRLDRKKPLAAPLPVPANLPQSTRS